MKTNLILFLLLCSCQLNAQIVNIEDKRTHRKDTSGIFGNVDLGANLVENGKTILTLAGGIKLELLRNKNLFLSLTNFNLVKVEENDFVNNGFQHFRYNYNFNNRLTYEAFLQGQYNERIRIQFRGLAGTGMRFQFVKKEKQKAFIGTAYMFEYEDIRDTSITHRNHRMSNYFSFNLKPFSTLTLSGTTYYQPLLSNFNDVRLSSQTAVQVQITTKLSLRIAFSLTYDSRLKQDAPDAPNTIYSLVNGLRWKF